MYFIAPKNLKKSYLKKTMQRYKFQALQLQKNPSFPKCITLIQSLQNNLFFGFLFYFLRYQHSSIFKSGSLKGIRQKWQLARKQSSFSPVLKILICPIELKAIVLLI